MVTRDKHRLGHGCFKNVNNPSFLLQVYTKDNVRVADGYLYLTAQYVSARSLEEALTALHPSLLADSTSCCLVLL